MEFTFQDTKVLHKIKVFGIGGGGNNAINNMILSGVTGPLFVAANSDMQDLDRNLAPHKIQVGSLLTKGLGCGGKADVGRAAAEEDIEQIKEMLGDSDMVFITAGMGGGTGSGGAPVVAEILATLPDPPLVVGVVTKPFDFEGPRRMKQAVSAIEELTRHCDCILVVPNEKLMATMPKGCSLQDAFHEADTVLLKAVQGITDLITGKGLVNVDFQDLKTVMTKRGPTIMGVGQATGDDRALKAALQAVSSPLLDDLTIDGAQGVLINITGPNNLGLEEVSTVCSLVTKEAHPDAEIFHGVTFDDSLAEEGIVKVTVIATGLGGRIQQVQMSDDESPAVLETKNLVDDDEPEEKTPLETEIKAQADLDLRASIKAEMQAEEAELKARMAADAAQTAQTQPQPQAIPAFNTVTPVMVPEVQPQPAMVLPSGQSPESIPEQYPARRRLSSSSRRNRLAKRYETIHLDGADLDVPTYMRLSAD